MAIMARLASLCDSARSQSIRHQPQSCTAIGMSQSAILGVALRLMPTAALFFSRGAADPTA
jgi:hypothetical protein